MVTPTLLSLHLHCASLCMSNPPSRDQCQQGFSLSGDESVDGGDGTWPNYNSFQYGSPSSSAQQTSSLNYGNNLMENVYFPSSPPMVPQAAYDQITNDSLAPLDYDLPNPLLNFKNVPTINLNRSNTIPPESAQDWIDMRAYLSPIETAVQGHASPGFSTPSQTSGSSRGLLSPHRTDPMTPSTTSSHDLGYTTIRPPGSTAPRFDSQSPAVGLGLEFDKMYVQPDQSPRSSGTSSGRASFALPSSSPNSAVSEPFVYNSWGPLQMTPNHARSVSVSTGTNCPYSQDNAGPSSAPAVSTMTLADPQPRVTYSHAEQYQSWKDTPNTCPIASPPRIFIPQRMYKPHTGSDRRRYVEEVRLSPPIVFEVEHPSEWGIPLDDAIKCRTKRLLEKDALMFEGCGPSVSIRLEWPGAAWSRQIPTKDFRSPPGPITKAKLAKNIAKCVQRFIKDTHAKPINDEEDTNALRFKVGTGPSDVKLEDLILVSLHHVSQGSWQPHLRLRRVL